MKKILHWLIDFIREDFRSPLYLGTALFLAVGIVINYTINLENGIIDAHQGEWIRFPMYWFLYALAYFPVAIGWAVTHGRPIWRLDFWLRSIFGISVIALWQSFTGYQTLLNLAYFQQAYSFFFHCLANLASAVTVWLPFGLFYFGYEKSYENLGGFYGLRAKWQALMPYGVMLLGMFPLIGAASFLPDFQATYPVFKTWDSPILGWPKWVAAPVFELCYGFDFISTELIFRGFLVIGIAKTLGRGAVLPMVVLYAFIHFGKPVGETISSVFGGYILGVLAYKSKNIWGGVAIHLGVAWLMELMAFLQKA